MTLWEEAVRIRVFGIEMYAFGLYCAVGALCSLLAAAVLCRAGRMKQGTAPLLGLTGILLGMVCSRIVFCLLNFELGVMMPLSSWFRITTGGWSLFGMIGGVMLAAYITARLTWQNPGRMLDITVCALPLMIAAERLGEGHLQGFNVSRQLPEGFLSDGILTVRDGNAMYLATHRIAAAAAIILFVLMILALSRKNRKNGDVWVLFLLLCGAGGVLMESLRYDKFMEYSFVRFQQVMAAVMLAAGLVLAIRRNRDWPRGAVTASVVCLVLAILGCVAIEFALDRTTISHVLLYCLMVLLLAVPVIFGILFLNGKGQRNS